MAVSLVLVLATPVLAQVQLDHGTAERLTALGINTSEIVQEDDVGYINQILASDADDATKNAEHDATKKAEIEKLITDK